MSSLLPSSSWLRKLPSLSERRRQLKRPDTTGDFHMVVWGRLVVVWNAVLKTGPGADNTILAGNSYKMADTVDLMAALQAFLLLLVILRRRRTQRQRRKHRFWVREIFQRREQFGWYHTLARELRLSDREYYFR